MEKFVERLIEIKPATKIGVGTGIFLILYFVYALCVGGFTFAALASALISLIIGAIFFGICLFAGLMILDGLLSLGE